MKAKEFLTEYGPWSGAPKGKLGGGASVDMSKYQLVDRRPFQSFVRGINLEKKLLPWSDLLGDQQDTIIYYTPGDPNDIIAIQGTASSGSTTPARWVRNDYL